MTGKTSVTAVLVHAVVFGLALYLLKTYYGVEGFIVKDAKYCNTPKGKKDPECKTGKIVKY
jgi:hypothetical protein